MWSGRGGAPCELHVVGAVPEEAGMGGQAEGRVFLSALLNCCFRRVGGLGRAIAGGERWSEREQKRWRGRRERVTADARKD